MLSLTKMKLLYIYVWALTREIKATIWSTARSTALGAGWPGLDVNNGYWSNKRKSRGSFIITAFKRKSFLTRTFPGLNMLLLKLPLDMKKVLRFCGFIVQRSRILDIAMHKAQNCVGLFYSVLASFQYCIGDFIILKKPKLQMDCFSSSGA